MDFETGILIRKSGWDDHHYIYNVKEGVKKGTFTSLRGGRKVHFDAFSIIEF